MIQNTINVYPLIKLNKLNMVALNIQQVDQKMSLHLSLSSAKSFFSILKIVYAKLEDKESDLKIDNLDEPILVFDYVLGAADRIDENHQIKLLDTITISLNSDEVKTTFRQLKTVLENIKQYQGTIGQLAN